MDISSFKRNCPKCNKEILYSRKDALKRAENQNRLCLSCSITGEKNGFFGKHHSKETLNFISNKLKGKKLSKSHIQNRTISQTGLKRSPETCRKISESQIGKIVSIETRNRQRISAIKRLQKYQLYNKPNFNPNVCKFIDKLNNLLRLNLQHALNGGEVWLRGFYPDGYDKEKNVVFEYDEKWHNNSYKKLKDLQRQKIILDKIKPSQFLRYDEKSNRLYDCKTQETIPILL